MSRSIDLRTSRRLHVVGVGGPGMSAVALALVDMGHRVSGSDIRESTVLDRLRERGVDVRLGHDEAAIVGCDGVTASPAIPESNPEVAAARIRGTFLTRAQMLASICAVRPTIGVAGTHGKTTTTALVVRCLERAELDPAFIVGGDLIDEGTNARWGTGPWTVVEADESDGTHLHLPLVGTILTNVDVDHLDHFTDFAAIVDSFRQYLRGITGPKVVCIDDSGCRQVLEDARLADDASIITYGSDSGALIRFSDVEVTDHRTTFTVHPGGDEPFRITTSLRGLHNVANITAVVAMMRALDVPMATVVRAVAEFSGVGRRFQIAGEHRGITLVDDYAHLPREIEAVLQAARDARTWRRVVAVFQPNRFNRMAVLSPAYADSFDMADIVVVTDIYASGTARIDGVTGEMVVEAVRNAHPGADVRWSPRRDTLAAFVAPILEPGDICISMGCGDIETLPAEILTIMRDDNGREDHGID